MARKKTTKEEDTVTETKKNSFDWKTTLNTYECSNLLKSGFGYYVEVNNITINSEKELEKQFNKFKNGNAGV